MYTRLHSHGSEQGLWVVAGKKIMNLWLNWPIKTMRRPIMNTLNQLFCSFQNCENWLSVEMIICIILQGGIFIGAESDNVEWDPENNCEKREIEKENTNVDDQASDVITCDGNGDLILRRRPKRQRYSQSKISFFPVSLSHTSTPSKTQYSWFPCYDHIVFLSVRATPCVTVKRFSQILTFKVFLGQCYAHLTHEVHIYHKSSMSTIYWGRWLSKGNPSLNINSGQWRCMI